MDWITSTARVWGMAISTSASMGPPACSFRSAARPSQNWAIARLELNTVGELTGPGRHLWPMAVFRLSTPPRDRLWQVLQEIIPDMDRRGSKKSCLPNSTLAGDSIFAGSMGWIGSLRTFAACAEATPTLRAIPIANPSVVFFIWYLLGKR